MKHLFFLFLLWGISIDGFSQDGDFYNLYFEGNAALAKAQYDKAIEKYNKAEKLFKADYIYFNRGNAYLGKKDYSNALLDYSKTITMNTNYAEAYCQRGIIKTATGDKTACEDLKKAVKLDLEDAKPIFKKNCK